MALADVLLQRTLRYWQSLGRLHSRLLPDLSPADLPGGPVVHDGRVLVWHFASEEESSVTLRQSCNHLQRASRLYEGKSVGQSQITSKAGQNQEFVIARVVSLNGLHATCYMLHVIPLGSRRIRIIVQAIQVRSVSRE